MYAAGRLRPRRLRGRRRRARRAAAARGGARRLRARPRLIGRAFQRLFPGAPHRGGRAGSAGTPTAPFAPGTTLGEALLAPTRIYVKPLLALHRGRAAARRGAYHRRRPPRQPARAACRPTPSPCSMPPPGRRRRSSPGSPAPAGSRRPRCCAPSIAASAWRLSCPTPTLATEILEAHGETVFELGRIEAEPGPAAVRDRAAAARPGMSRDAGLPCSSAGAAATWPRCSPPRRHPDYPAEIALVLSNRADAAGPRPRARRGVEALALDHRPFRGDRAAHEAAIDAALAARGVELVCLAGYMRVLTPWLVARWRGRMLNIHPSPAARLPGPRHPCPRARRRGAAARLHGASRGRGGG